MSDRMTGGASATAAASSATAASSTDAAVVAARLIYLHGFRSSPQSHKARAVGERMAELGLADRFACPALPPSPRKAVALVEQAIAPGPSDVLVGSSLGGYYARWLAERHGCRAVLLNPAVRPYDDLARYLGVQTMYHDPSQRFEVLPAYLDELLALKVARFSHPARCLLVAATGDELIDWREMVADWPGATHRVIQGSDHALSDFAEHLDAVLAFAGFSRRP